MELIVQGKPLKFKIDTGASLTLISEETNEAHCQNKPLQNSKLKTYTEEQLQVLGWITVDVSYYSQLGSYTLHVVKGSGPCLLGRDWLKHIKLDWKDMAMSVNQVNMLSYKTHISQYSEVFNNELGTLKCTQGSPP